MRKNPDREIKSYGFQRAKGFSPERADMGGDYWRRKSDEQIRKKRLPLGSGSPGGSGGGWVKG
jgi:hypothetical protein